MYLLVILRMSKNLWDIDRKRMVPFKPFFKVKRKNYFFSIIIDIFMFFQNMIIFNYLINY